MNVYERIKTLLTEGTGIRRAMRVLYSKKDKGTKTPGTDAVQNVNSKRLLRGLKNTGQVHDPKKTLGTGKPDLYKRAVASGHRGTVKSDGIFK